MLNRRIWSRWWLVATVHSRHLRDVQLKSGRELEAGGGSREQADGGGRGGGSREQADAGRGGIWWHRDVAGSGCEGAQALTSQGKGMQIYPILVSHTCATWL